MSTLVGFSDTSFTQAIKQNAHSVVTNDLVDQEGHPTRQALDRVLAFFRQQLLQTA